MSECYLGISSGDFFASSGQLKLSDKELIRDEAAHFPKPDLPKDTWFEPRIHAKKPMGSLERR